MSTIDTTNLTHIVPLYKQYPGEGSPQPAYLEIDPDENTGQWDYSSDIGNAAPAAVCFGLILRVPVSSTASRYALEKLSNDPVLLAMIDRVSNGYSVEWSGNNHVGTLDADASDALHEIEKYISDVDEFKVWTDDWLNGEIPDADVSTMSDDEICALIDRLHDEAEAEGYYVPGLADEVREIVDQARA